jgi:hypothetical protein
MKSPWFPIAFVTAFLFIYTGLLAMGASYTLMVVLFSLSPFLVIWMVVRVLKSKPVSTKTFNEHFYLDHAYRKIPDEAENA